MRVLVADAFEETGLTALKAAGCDVLYQPDLKDAALVDAIRTSGAEVLVVRSTKVTEAMLDAGRLALVVRAGAGDTERLSGQPARLRHAGDPVEPALRRTRRHGDRRGGHCDGVRRR